MNIMKKALLAIVGVTASVSALVYNVGPGKQYSTLQSVSGLLNGGDTVLVAGDTTYNGGVVFNRPGRTDAPIFVKGVTINGRRPLIKGATNTVHFATAWPYNGGGADNYIFENFDITEGTFRGIFLQANNLTIRNVKVFNCVAHGILAADQGSGNITLEGVELYGCGSGSSQHQIYVTTDQVHFPGSVFKMRFCYLHDAKGGNNVKSRSERNEIHYNWIEGAYYHELELIGPDPGGLDDLPQWNPRLKREDSEVIGNVLIKKATQYSNPVDFSIVRFGGDGTGESHGRYVVTNNTMICAGAAVFRLFDSLESVAAYNNVIYRSGGAPNIMRTAEAEWTTGVQQFTGSNNWIVTGSTNVPAAWVGTITGSTPLFNTTSADTLKPATGSVLINGGTSNINGNSIPLYHPPTRKTCTAADAVIRPVNGAVDIGAYESSTPASVQPLNIPANEKVISIKTFDILGRPVKTNSRKYLPGIYILLITTDRGIRTAKQIKL
ncbi:MAG: T9SS type A sorting domain-containing protein [Fibrobacteres bacterium]|nr:T9SS type A sorting domain-containing protein [Fibrobacterota bacterium]